MIFNNQKIVGTKTYTIDGEAYTVNVCERFVKELPGGYVVVSEELWNKLRNFSGGNPAERRERWDGLGYSKFVLLLLQSYKQEAGGGE